MMVLRVVTGCVEEFPDHNQMWSKKLSVPTSTAAAGNLLRRAMTEQHPLEVLLEDTELLTEVQLLTDLIIAGTHAEDDLDLDELDEILDIPR